MTNPSIAAAMAIARTRHTALACGDFEAYSALDGDISDACAAVVELGPGTLAQADIPELDELIALETQSRMLLDALMAEAAASLGTLRRSQRANGAYWSHERLSVNGA